MKKTFIKAISLAVALILLAPALVSCSGGLKERYDGYNTKGERYDLDLTEYIAIPEYRGVEIPDVTYVPSEEDVDDKRMQKRAYFAPETSVNGPCEKYDLVDADYSATLEGQRYTLFDSSVLSSRRSFMVGVGYFGVKEIDDAIIGMKPGDVKTIEFTLPEPFLKDVPSSGLTGKFTIKIDKVRRQDFPEYTDSFVSEYYGFSTTDSYDAEIAEQLTHDVSLALEGYEVKIAWDYVYGNAVVYKYPGRELGEARDDIVESYLSAAEAAGKTLDDYVVSLGFADRNEFYDKYVEGYAREIVKNEMILYLIARCEGLKLSDSEYEKELLEYCASYETNDVDTCRLIVADTFGTEAKFREQVYLKKAQDILGSAALKIDAAEYYENKHAGKYELAPELVTEATRPAAGDTTAIVILSVAAGAVLVFVVVMAVLIVRQKKKKK